MTRRQAHAVAAGLDIADGNQFNARTNQMKTGMNYVGFRRRFVAWIIDVLILSPFLVATGFLVQEYLEATSSHGYVDAQVGAFWMYFYMDLVISIYVIGFWTWRGQTPGKMVMRIKIMKSDGRRIGIGRAILRYIGHISYGIIALILFSSFFFILRGIPWFTKSPGLSLFVVATFLFCILFTLLPYWLTIALDRKKQGLHDKIAKTYVVNTHQAESLEIGSSAGNL